MERLKSILQFINEDDIVADIGCDHGYLLELAIKNKNIKKCYAVDNKIGPLNSAKKNLEKYDNVSFVLSDGLIELDSDDINCVVIAGMGGMLINKIFNDSKDKFKNIQKIIVAPNKDVDKVRMNFTLNGFKITEETICFEGDIYYEILVFEIGEQKLSEKEILFGPELLKGNNQLFLDKLINSYVSMLYSKSKREICKKIAEVIYDKCK